MFPIRDTIPSKHEPVLIRLLIGVNVLVFLFQFFLPEARLEVFFQRFGVVPIRITHPAYFHLQAASPESYWPFLTSMFLHGGLLHIIMNMWVLWIFGDNVEDRMGPVRFLLFYLGCGIAAMVFHTVTNPGSTMPAIGASGAIAGVMGAYFVLYPRAMVITLIPLGFIPLFIPIPAFIYLLFWFFLQFLSGAASLFGGGAAGGIAWWAHIGGFVTGMWAYSLFLRPEEKKNKV